MKLEQDNIRKFKFKMQQRKSDLLHELREQYKLGNTRHKQIK